MTFIAFLDARQFDGPGDGGIDIDATKAIPGGVERIAVQCKHVDAVEPNVARELLGVLTRDQAISKGHLVTSGRFTAACRRECEWNGRIMLVDGPLLARWIQQFGIYVN